MLGLKLVATGIGMMVLTVIIHALFMVGAARMAKWRRDRLGRPQNEVIKAVLVSGMTLWMFLAIAIEAGLWALLYLYDPMIANLPNLETAFYFSMVTFTTLGYGDVVLTDHWRTLASIQAANGVIIFGWTTALIFYFIQRIYTEK